MHGCASKVAVLLAHKLELVSSFNYLVISMINPKLSPTGERSSSNAFLSPQWGGIMIYNLHRTTSMNNTSLQRIAVDVNPVMNIFLSQLKLLLGVIPVVSMQIKPNYYLKV